MASTPAALRRHIAVTIRLRPERPGLRLTTGQAWGYPPSFAEWSPCGVEGSRTPGLPVASGTLYLLSYNPLVGRPESNRRSPRCARRGHPSPPFPVPGRRVRHDRCQVPRLRRHRPAGWGGCWARDKPVRSFRRDLNPHGPCGPPAVLAGASAVSPRRGSACVRGESNPHPRFRGPVPETGAYACFATNAFTYMS